MVVSQKPTPAPTWKRRLVTQAEPMKGAFFWLSAFFVVYCARPEDWIPGLHYIPLAKISGIFALIGLMLSAGASKRGLRDLPREAFYLFAVFSLLIVSALLSPVWKGGAFFKTLDFGKLLIAWVLTFIVINSFTRLRRIIFVQALSVSVIAVVSVLKGRSHPRLEGVIGGIYSNPNDLAFAIVLSLPFCVAFLLHTKNLLQKAAWVGAMVTMCSALFLTASRAGFINLMVTGAFGLWHFGVKGKRPQLIALAGFAVITIGLLAGSRLKDRFMAISGDEVDPADISAHGSYEQRRMLMELSLQTMVKYPLGLGMGNFPNYSGTWRQVHVAYLQIAVEGGIATGIFYLLFFSCGFTNLRRLRRIGTPDQETDLFARALHTSLIGFIIGALFAPEAYQFFPYFAVAYTSVLVAIAKEKQESAVCSAGSTRPPSRLTYNRAGELTPVR